MKKMLRYGLIASFLMMTIGNTYASETTDDIKLAANILKGNDDSKDKTWAIGIIRNAAENDSNAFAMNVLGIAYMHGIALDENRELSIRWLEKAGQHGFKNAYHNLGMIFKDGEPQDFEKACYFFKLGVDAESYMCYYDLGYMFYKGLGCEQDYTKAAELFSKGVDKDHSPCLYMLGLCYRNGYGVDQDLAKAQFYLNRAAELSYSRAIEELNREQPENNWTHIDSNVDGVEIPASMPDIPPFINKDAGIEGNYHGVIVTYDWSGENVINEQPLSLYLVIKGRRMIGKWCEGQDTIQVIANIANNDRLVFEEGAISKYDRYVEERPVQYCFEDADICIKDCFITGRLRLYSITYREPERPMYISLRKTAAENDKENTTIQAYPNPFKDQITISLDLEENASSSSVYIYNQSGVNIQSYKIGPLSAGKNTLTIHPSIPDGLYILRINAGKKQFQTIIVKNNGAI